MAHPPHVTRIAPSPTGLFHIGSARTALFNWLVARSTGGRFILRIDDTDAARNTPEAVAVIDDALSWLGLDHDVRIRQSDRFGLYRGLADGLVAKGLARRDGDAVLLAAPTLPDAWRDTLAGDIRVTDNDRKLADGLVLVRRDGTPTYHMASVADDMAMGVTWVVRGQDHLANTPKQVALWDALSRLDWDGAKTPMPLWTHVGLIMHGGKKVSKRDGSASLLDHRARGVDPDAMGNWLLRLGWGPTGDGKGDRTIDRDRALAIFLDGGRMRSSPANMDLPLLDSLNRKVLGGRERAARLAAAAP